MYCTTKRRRKKIALKICLLKHKKEKDTLKFASCKKISFKFCVLYSTTKKHPPQNLSVVPQTGLGVKLFSPYEGKNSYFLSENTGNFRFAGFKFFPTARDLESNLGPLVPQANALNTRSCDFARNGRTLRILMANSTIESARAICAASLVSSVLCLACPKK